MTDPALTAQNATSAPDRSFRSRLSPIISLAQCGVHITEGQTAPRPSHHAQSGSCSASRRDRHSGFREGKPQQGTVVAAGLGKSNDGGKRVPLEVKTGDTILFGKYSGQEIEVDGVEYLILNEEDVLAIADPGATTNTGVLKDGAARTPVNDIDPSAAR